MANDITGSTILEPVVLQIDNQDEHGRNWAFEIVQLTVGTNTSTTYTLSNGTTAWPAATVVTGMMKIKAPKFVTIDGMDDTSKGYKVTYGADKVVITWAVAPTGAASYRVKIEGYYD